MTTRAGLRSSERITSPSARASTAPARPVARRRPCPGGRRRPGRRRPGCRSARCSGGRSRPRRRPPRGTRHGRTYTGRRAGPRRARLRGLPSVSGHESAPGDDRGGDPGADGHERQVRVPTPAPSRCSATPPEATSLAIRTGSRHSAPSDRTSSRSRHPRLALYVATPAGGRRDRGPRRRLRPRRLGPLRQEGAADLGDRVARAVPVGRGPLLGGHHGAHGVDQLRLDGRAPDVDGERKPATPGHGPSMGGLGRAPPDGQRNVPWDTEPSSRRWKIR